MPENDDETDDSAIRFSLIEIGGFYDDDGNEIYDDPKAEAAIIPIDRERRYRELEAKCQKLESLLASKTSLDVARYGEEKHTFRCGQHPRVVVSENVPKVWCAVCEEQLDPIEVLRSYARKERNFIFGLQHDRHEAAALKKEIEELKRVRTNLMAQIRRRKTQA